MIDPDTNEVWVDDLWVVRPRYKHDCGACTFAGQWRGFDLYGCLDSYVARFSDAGPDYISAMGLPDFIEALTVETCSVCRQPDNCGDCNHERKPCPGCAEPCGQCDQEALD